MVDHLSDELEAEALQEEQQAARRCMHCHCPLSGYQWYCSPQCQQRYARRNAALDTLFWVIVPCGIIWALIMWWRKP